MSSKVPSIYYNTFIRQLISYNLNKHMENKYADILLEVFYLYILFQNCYLFLFFEDSYLY